MYFKFSNVLPPTKIVFKILRAHLKIVRYNQHTKSTKRKMASLSLTRPQIKSGKMLATPAKPVQTPAKPVQTPTIVKTPSPAVSLLLARIHKKSISNSTSTSTSTSGKEEELASFEDLVYTRPGSKEWIRCPGCQKEIKFQTVNGRPGYLCGTCIKDSRFAKAILNMPVACPKCETMYSKAELDSYHNESCESCFIKTHFSDLPIPNQLSCISQASEAMCKGENITVNEYLQFTGCCLPCTKKSLQEMQRQFEAGDLTQQDLISAIEQRQQTRQALIEKMLQGQDEEGGDTDYE